jgi:WD40 repeat protein/energy-coupling factor transporter ATP-binding protein EcfA2
MSEIDPPFNPFPGLRPFETDEDYLFFGRESQTDELLEKLKDHRFLAVVGTSGSGKSSLVRAGLLPALDSGFMVRAGSCWRIAILRPGNSPIRNLAEALNKPQVLGKEEDGTPELSTLMIETTLERGALSLVEVFKQAHKPLTENLLIVVDQFEELFRFKQTSDREDADEEASAFVKLLIEAARHPGVSMYVVLTMRSEFLGNCAHFRDLPETINDSQYLIPHMTREQLRLAIKGPVAVGGAEISPRLVNRLLNDVGVNRVPKYKNDRGRSDYLDQLPILQHALMRTWAYWIVHREKEAEPIDLAHYEAIGGMAKALSNHADEVYDSIPKNQKEIAETLFKRLTDKGPYGREIRRPTKLKELCEVADTKPSEVVAIVDRFRAPGCSFLMPLLHVPLTQETMLDISHESLMRIWDRLSDWVDEERQSVQIYRRLAESATLFNEGKTGLCRDPELTIALTWREDNHPNKAWAERYNSLFDKAIFYLDESKKKSEDEIARRERNRQEKQERAEQEIENQKRINKKLRTFSIIAFLGSTATGLSVLMFLASQIKFLENNTKTFLKLSNTSFKNNSSELDSLAYTMSAIKSLDWEIFNWASALKDPKIEDHVLGSLIQSAYSVREFNQLEGHGEEINSISFSKDGKYLASSSDDRSIILWDLKNNKSKIFRGHSNRINSVSYSPDGKRIASGSDDKTIKIWDLKGNIIQSLEIDKAYITSVHYSPDGKILASATDDNSVVLWKENKGKFELFKKILHSNILPGNRVKAVSFSPDGKSLASAGWDGIIKIWDLNGILIKSKSLETSCRKSQGSTIGEKKLTSISFSSDGKTIAVGSLDNSIVLWNLKNNCTKELNTHTARVMNVSFSSNNNKNYLASASRDGTVKIWNIDTIYSDNAKSEFLTLNVLGTKSAKFSSDGILATTSANNRIKLWNLPEISSVSLNPQKLLMPEIIKATKGYSISGIDLSSDGKIIVSGEVDSKSNGKIVFYDSQTKKDLRLSSNLKCGNGINLQSSPVDPSIFLISEKCLNSKNSKKSIIEIWNLNHKKFVLRKEIKDEIKFSGFSYDGKKIAIMTDNSGLFIWNLYNNSFKSISLQKKIDFNTINFIPSDDMLLLGGADGKIYLSDLNGKMDLPFKAVINQHTDGINSLQVSDDGKNIVSGSFDKTIRLWNLKDRNKNQLIGTDQDGIENLSLKGTWLASSSPGGGAKIWSLIDQENHLLSTMKGNSSINKLKFSPNKKTLITSTYDEIQIWNTDLDTLKKSSCLWLNIYSGYTDEGHQICSQLMLEN